MADTSSTPITDGRSAERDAHLATVADRAASAYAERGLEVEWSRGELILAIGREHHRELAAFLRDDPDLLFARFVDLCGLDAVGLGRSSRLAVMFRLHSFHLARWVAVRVPLDESDPKLSSLALDWPAANWYEREAHDLFGIEFVGHPNLERILLPDDWEGGYPLRKDHPFAAEVVEFSFNVDRINAGQVVPRPKLRNVEKR